MANLNVSSRSYGKARIAKEATVNLAGGLAFKMNAKESLIERAVGAFWSEDLAYAKGSDTAAKIVEDIKSVAAIDPKFPLQVAAWARNDLNMRTTPQVILVEAANIEACKPFVRQYTPKIVKRADELAEVIAYQLSAHGKPIPNSLKKGLADSFATFDEYQLNKYNSDKGAVSLSDVLHLIYRRAGYPVSKPMWNYLVNGEVDAEALPKTAALKDLLAHKGFDSEAKELISKSSATWETVTSHFGSSKEVWESVIPNMGYMALLRNLRNFEQKGVNLDDVIRKISDPYQVKRSKQLPFRFWSAYKNVSNADLRTAVSRAFEASISNVRLDGRTGVIVDLSGSMSSKASEKSDMTYREIASVMAAIATKKSDRPVVVGFADRAQTISLNPDDTMMTNIAVINNTHVGGSTYAHLGFTELAKHGEFDRILLLSDMQCYSQSPTYFYNSTVFNEWNDYTNRYPKARLYSFDLSAYGTKQIPAFAKNAVTVNGWSDKIFDFIALSEGKSGLEELIAKW